MSEIIYDIPYLFYRIFGEDKPNTTGNHVGYKKIFYDLFFRGGAETNVLKGTVKPRYFKKPTKKSREKYCLNEWYLEIFDDYDCIDADGGRICDINIYRPQKDEAKTVDDFANFSYVENKKLIQEFNESVGDTFVRDFLNDSAKLIIKKDIDATVPILFKVVVAVSYLHMKSFEEKAKSPSEPSQSKKEDPKELCRSYIDRFYSHNGRYGGYRETKNANEYFESDRFEDDLGVDGSRIDCGGEKKVYTLAEVLLENGEINNISLTGSGGSGKTFCILNTIYELLDGDDVYPIYIPLNRFAAVSEIDDLEKSVIIKLLSLNEFSENVDGWLSENGGKTVLFLDGFNEISEHRIRYRILQDILYMVGKYNVHFVLSSRIDHSDEFNRLGAKLACRKSRICPLTEATVINACRDIDGFDYDRLTPTQKGFLSTPMGLHIFTKTKKNSISSLGELLQEYLKLVLGARGEYTDENNAALSSIAFQMVSKGRFVLEKDELDELEIANPNVDILSVNDSNEFEFVHQNYRDFYCALYLNRRINGRIDMDTLALFNSFGSYISDEILQLTADITDTSKIQDALDAVAEPKMGLKNFFNLAISTIIKLEALKHEDRNIAALRLDNTNLMYVNLNSLKLYTPDGSASTSFNFSNYSKQTFLQNGHSSACRTACVVGDYVITLSDREIFYFNLKTAEWHEMLLRSRVNNHSREQKAELIKNDAPYYETVSFITPMEYPLPLPSICTCAPFGENVVLAGCSDGNIWFMDIHKGKGLMYSPLVCMSERAYKHDNSVCSIESVGEICVLVSFAGGCIKQFKAECESRILLEEREIHVDCESEKTKTMLCRSGRDVFVSCGLKVYKCGYDLSNLCEICDLSGRFGGFEIFDLCCVSGYILLNLRGESSSVFCLISKKGALRATSDMAEHKNGFFGYTRFGVDERYFPGTAFIGADSGEGLLSANLYEASVKKFMGKVKLSVKESEPGGRQNSTTYCAVPLPNKTVATCSKDRSFQMIKAGDEESVPVVFKGTHDGVHDILFYEEDEVNYMLAAGYDGCVSRWYRDEDDKWYCCNVYNIHGDWVWQIALSGDLKYLLSCSYDGTVRKTELESEKSEVLMRSDNKDAFLSLAICGDTVYAVTMYDLYSCDLNGAERRSVSLGGFGEGRIICEHDGEIYIVTNDKVKKEAKVLIRSDDTVKPVLLIPDTFIRTTDIIKTDERVVCALGGENYLGVVVGMDKLVLDGTLLNVDEIKNDVEQVVGYKRIFKEGSVSSAKLCDSPFKDPEGEEKILNLAVCFKDNRMNNFALNIKKLLTGYKEDDIVTLSSGTAGNRFANQPVCVAFAPFEDDDDFLTGFISNRLYIGLLDGSIVEHYINASFGQTVVKTESGLLSNCTVKASFKDKRTLRGYFKPQDE